MLKYERELPHHRFLAVPDVETALRGLAVQAVAVDGIPTAGFRFMILNGLDACRDVGQRIGDLVEPQEPRVFIVGLVGVLRHGQLGIAVGLQDRISRAWKGNPMRNRGIRRYGSNEG